MLDLSVPLYDRVLARTEAGGLRDWRRALLSAAEGDILEIGPGTGLNLPHYPQQGVRHLTLSEPGGGMRRQLDARLSDLSPPFPTTVRPDPADRLPDEDASFDVVVCTLVLCTVPDPQAVLSEVRRVLRPGGRLLFIEHVVAERGLWVTGQRLLEPLWKPLAGGCCLTRDSLSAIRAAGFTVSDPVRAALPRAPGFVRPSVRGVAIR